MKPAKVIVVCDEPRLLRAVVRQARHWVDLVETLACDRAIYHLERHPGSALLVTERLLRRQSGIDFLMDVSRRFPEVCRCLLACYADLAAVVRAVHEGFVDSLAHVPLTQRQFVSAVTQKPLRAGMQHDIPAANPAPAQQTVVTAA